LESVKKLFLLSIVVNGIAEEGIVLVLNDGFDVAGGVSSMS
jgi:hypothetical protein